MRSLLIVFIFFIISFNLSSQSFEKGTKVFYLGSAASSRYLDQNFFKDKTEEYFKSPIVGFGFDYCFSTIRDVSNSRLGIGPYFSAWSAIHEYTDSKNIVWENQWTDVLAAARFTHHLTYFTRKHLDMCSGIIVGARYKYYHYIEKQGAELPSDYHNSKFYPAVGITATVRYYFYKNMGLFAEGSFGYKTDLLLFGLCYKVQRAN